MLFITILFSIFYTIYLIKNIRDSLLLNSFGAAIFINNLIPYILYEYFPYDSFVLSEKYLKPVVIYSIISILLTIIIPILFPVRRNRQFSSNKISSELLLYAYAIIIVVLLYLSSFHLTVIVPLCAIILSLFQKNKVYLTLFVPIIFLSLGAFQRSIALPFIYLMFFLYQNKKIGGIKVIGGVIIVVALIGFALVGRSTRMTPSVSSISNINISLSDFLMTTFYNSTMLRVGTMVFEMADTVESSFTLKANYILYSLIPAPAAILPFDFQTFSVAKYLGVDHSIGIPMPFYYELYFFIGYWGIIFQLLLMLLMRYFDNLHKRLSEITYPGLFFYYTQLSILTLIIYAFHSPMKACLVHLIGSFIIFILFYTFFSRKESIKLR